MDNKSYNNHCEEVKSLMQGKTPFVTRHGISVIVALVIFTLTILYFTDKELFNFIVPKIHLTIHE